MQIGTRIARVTIIDVGAKDLSGLNKVKNFLFEVRKVMVPGKSI